MDAGVLSAIIVVAVAAALLDLWRHEVRQMPKWGWVLIIAFFIPPIGVLLYVVLERTPLGDP